MNDATIIGDNAVYDPDSPLHHVVVLGEGARATEAYQFVFRFRLTPGGRLIQVETVMTPEEYEVVSRVVRRAVEHPATPSFPQES